MVPDLEIAFRLPAGENKGDPRRAFLALAASIAFHPSAQGHKVAHGLLPQHLRVRLIPFPC